LEGGAGPEKAIKEAKYGREEVGQKQSLKQQALSMIINLTSGEEESED